MTGHSTHTSVLTSPDRLAAVERARAIWSDRARVIAALAAQMLHAEIAQVNLVTDLVVEPLGAVPLGGPVPVGESYCQNVVGSGTCVVVYDSVADPRVNGVPLAAQFRAYLGIPLQIDGQVAGALCVVGREPREWTPLEIELLTEIAQSLEADRGA